MKVNKTLRNTIFLPFIILMLYTSLSGQSPGCHPDYDALMAFYNSTNGNTWSNNSGWGTNCLPCTWHGVTCDGNNRVYQLVFQSNNLTGTLPPEIEQLENLYYLDLYSNFITGSIPLELGNLPNLGYLLIYNNQLSGTIPAELGNLSALTNLDLGRNQLTGNIPAALANLGNLTNLNLGENQLVGNIPDAFGELSAMQFLYLDYNQLSGNIPASIGNLSNLIRLDLASNQLTGNIPPELGNLGNLELLWLNENQLTGNIPAALGMLNNLTQLILRGNQLEGNIPGELGNLSNLQTLFLNSNQLSGNLPESLGNLTLLSDLRLSNNMLSGELPSSIGNLSNLALFYMNNNNFFGCFPASYSNLCNQLSSYSFENNPCLWENGNFDGFCAGGSCTPGMVLLTTDTTICQGAALTIEAIPGTAHEWSTGETGTASITVMPSGDATYSITVSDNFGCNREDIINVAVTASTNPEDYASLVAFYQNTGGDNWNNRDNWLMNCDVCSWFGISCNGNQEVIGIELPDNNLTGNLPGTLSSITTLQSLNLGNNNLEGCFPPDYTTLCTQLTDNNFSNNICLFGDGNFAAFCSGESCEDFSLTNDTLICEGESITLEATGGSFYLWSTGETSAVIEVAPGSTTVYEVYIDNGFGCLVTKTVTVDVGGARHPAFNDLMDFYNSTNGDNWTNKDGWGTDCDVCNWAGISCDGSGNVTGINLIQNNLAGTIPSSIGNLTNLSEIYLQNNQLTGIIPEALGNLSNLQVLGLMNNLLSGSIPESFGNLSTMFALGLSDNQLEGELPASLANAPLTVLLLNNNNLSGCFPVSYQSFCNQLSEYSFVNNPCLWEDGNFDGFCAGGNCTTSSDTPCCEDEVTIDESRIISAIYTADSIINSAGQATNGIVVFEAGNYIALNPGFEIGTGVDFCADIAPCGESDCPVEAAFITSVPFPALGDQVIFTNQSINATEVQWFINGIAVSEEDEIAFNFNTTGTYAISLLAKQDTCADIQAKTLNISRTPSHDFPVTGYSWETDTVTQQGISEKLPMVVYDRFENAYTLEDIRIPDNSTQAGIFLLHFEDIDNNTNTGFDDPSPLPGGSPLSGNCQIPCTTVGEASTAVIVQVFEDLSRLLAPGGNPANLPVPYTLTSPQLIEIKVTANSFNNQPMPPAALGVASQYYIDSGNGLSYGEVWKTINTGFDSYFNLGSTPFLGNTFHGAMAINLAGINWYLDLAQTTTIGGGQFDLYSVALHEALHALGFASLVGQSGTGIGGSGRYSPYDTYLTTGTTPVLTSVANCNNFNFNVTPATLTGGCNTLFFSGNGTSNNNQVVYSPAGWQQGSSISHFNCSTGGGCTLSGNGYVMNFCSGQGASAIQRAPHISEVETLCDLGYNLQGVYGDGTFTAPTNYPGSCGTNFHVAGTNDFRPYTAANTATDFTVVAGNTISFTGLSANGILSNDFNAATFDCVEMVIGGNNTNLVVNIGSQTIDYTPPAFFAGTAVIKYRPVNAAGHKGNMTYIFVTVTPAPLPPCTPNGCNIICHGDFEVFPAPSGTFHVGGLGPLSGFAFNPNGQNSPDLRVDNSNNQFTLIAAWTGNPEGIIFELTQPIEPGCTAEISFLGSSIQQTNVHAQILGSEDPPCINSTSTICNTPSTGCPGFDAICMADLLITNVATPSGFGGQGPAMPNFQNYTASFTNTQTFDINHVAVRAYNPVSGGGFLVIDDIEIEKNCNLPLIITATPDNAMPCIGDQVTITYDICIDQSATTLTTNTDPIDLQLNLPVDLTVASGDFSVAGAFTIPPNTLSTNCTTYQLTSMLTIGSGTPTGIPVTVDLNISGGGCSLANGQNSVTLTAGLSNQLTIDKRTTNGLTFNPGDPVNYEIETCNTSLVQTISNIIVEDVLSTDLNTATLVTTDFTLAGNTLSSGSFNLAPGTCSTLTFTINIDATFACGSISNCAKIAQASGTCQLPTDCETISAGAVVCPGWPQSIENGLGSPAPEIQVSTDGDVYVTGGLSGPSNFTVCGTTTTINAPGFVAKYNSCGSLIWVETIPYVGYDLGLWEQGGQVVIYITGHTNQSTFPRTGYTTRFTDNGGSATKDWEYDITGTDAFSLAIDTDQNGNAYTTGYIYQNATFNAANGSVPGTASINNALFVARFDPGGNLTWHQMIDHYALPDPNCFSTVTSQGIAVDDTGSNIYLLGTGRNVTLDFGTGSCALTITPNNPTFCTGADIFMAVYEQNGGGYDCNWVEQITGNGFNAASDIDVNSTTGDFYISGWATDNSTSASGFILPPLSGSPTLTRGHFMAKYTNLGGSWGFNAAYRDDYTSQTIYTDLLVDLTYDPLTDNVFFTAVEGNGIAPYVHKHDANNVPAPTWVAPNPLIANTSGRPSVATNGVVNTNGTRNVFFTGGHSTGVSFTVQAAAGGTTTKTFPHDGIFIVKMEDSGNTTVLKE